MDYQVKLAGNLDNRSVVGSLEYLKDGSLPLLLVWVVARCKCFVSLLFSLMKTQTQAPSQRYSLVDYP